MTAAENPRLLERIWRHPIWRHVLWATASIAVAFGLWALIVAVFDVKPYIVPTPSAALSSVADHWSQIWPLSIATLKETLWGFVVGALVGFALAVFMFLVPVLQRLMFPVVIASQAVPIIALAPILVIILGFGLLPKIVVVTLFVFFPVTIATLDGLSSVDPDLISLSRVLGADRWRTFWLIEVPSASTAIFTGLKLGATYAVAGAIIGESAASSGSSLYVFQHDAAAFNDVALVYGTTLVMTAIGLMWFLLIVAIANFSTPWTSRTTARRWPWRGRNSLSDLNAPGKENP